MIIAPSKHPVPKNPSRTMLHARIKTTDNRVIRQFPLFVSLIIALLVLWTVTACLL